VFDAAPPAAPPLRLRDVTVRAPSGRTILRAAALDVAPGATIGIR
jgi:hypothetical protein